MIDELAAEASTQTLDLPSRQDPTDLPADVPSDGADRPSPDLTADAPPAVFNLAEAIRTKIAADGQTISGAAKAIGVSPLVIGNIFAKGSKPNVRTADKFAAWLGVDVALITGSGKSARSETPARAPKAVASARSEAPTRTGDGRSIDEVLAIVKAALEAAQTPAVCDDPILTDDLAREVHQAPDQVRKAVAAMLAAMPR